MIASYLESLLANQLLLPPWGVVALWAALFAVNHAIFLRAGTLRRAQAVVLAPESGPRGISLLVRQVVFAVVIFIAAFVLGEPYASFFAGGLVVMMALAIGLNLHSMLFASALGSPGNTEGSVKLSATVVLRTRAAQIYGAGVGCLCAMLIVPHLALAGAALFLLSAGYGFQRRARRVAAA